MIGTIRKQVFKHRFLDLADSTTAFLAGSGRSGTTWVEDLINYRQDHRIIFEPFWGKQVPFCKSFNEKPYLRATNADPQFLEPARRIVHGAFRNEWTDKFNTHWIYRYRLIKDIRANLFLYWLHTHFPTVPIILLMRHPLAVIASQLQQGWKLKRKYFLHQPDLMTDFLTPFADTLTNCTDEFDILVLRWCVENYVPLKQFQPGTLHLVFYEELLHDPEREIERLFRFLGRPITAGVFAQFQRPSAVTHQDSVIHTGGDTTSAWRNTFSSAQIQRAIDLLRMFGLDRIYDDSPMPRMNAATVMLEDTLVAAS